MSVQTSAASPIRMVIDAVVAVALFGTLAVVCVVDLAVSSPPVGPDGGEGPDEVAGGGAFIEDEQEKEHVEVSETPPQPKPMRLAVTPREYDDMGSLLKKLGEGYRYDNLELDDLLNADTLGKYDVVFVTCGGVPDHWVGERIGEGQRGATVYEPKQEIVEGLRRGLREYVKSGGIVYASDWRFTLLQLAFDEFADRGKLPVGSEQIVEAEVVDGGLRELLGSSIELRFDKDGWNPATFSGEAVKVYLQGTFKTLEDGDATRPLLVKIRFGEGEIFFTAFHNEKQNSEKELQLLRYLVFTMVTSRVESRIRETMVRGGFSPQKQSLLSTSANEPSVTKTYQCEKAGRLQFVLGFEKRGALLNLKVTGPNNRVFEKEGEETLTIEVPDAEVGQWKYTVTAKRVPFENFPFTLNIGQK